MGIFLSRFTSHLNSYTATRSRKRSENIRHANRVRYRRYLVVGELLEDRAMLTGLVGTHNIGPTGEYASIGAAISAIQANGLEGAVTLELQPTYVGAVEVFPLTFSNLGTTVVNTLTLRPEAGATNLSISSENTTAATIDLDGAKFLTIDGRPGGLGSNAGSGSGSVSQLTIANTSTSGVAVRFINEASDNTIAYTIFQGLNSSATSGTIVFGTTIGLNGNDNNTIDHCDLGDGLSTPANGIFALGSTGTTAQNNSGNTISNCNDFNFYAAVDAAGIRLGSGNTGWTLSGNSFYQTVSRLVVAANMRAIYISNTSGNDFVVSGNFIGGSAPNAGGTAWTATALITGQVLAYRFQGIYLDVGTITSSNIHGNTIANINWTSSISSLALPGVWSGIYVLAGSANIGTVTGNTIGSATGTGSVSVATSGDGGTSFGIASASSSTVSIANNTIGSIKVSNRNSVSASLTGIAITAGTTIISNNILGSNTTASSLDAVTSSTSTIGQQVTGILSSSSTSASITGNTVANLNNNYAGSATTGQVRGIVTSAGVNTVTGNTVRDLSTKSGNTNSTTTQSVLGIMDTSTAAGQNVSQNTVHSLTNTSNTPSVNVTGIYFAGPTSGTNVIARNLVHSLADSAAAFTSSVLNGMLFAAGTFTAQNNMVRLGIKADGTSTAADSTVVGIYDSGTTAGRNFYHNSVYLGGKQTSGSTFTVAFQSNGATNARTFQNNIFVNARSSISGFGKHIAVQYGGTGVNPTGLTAGGNLFLASGTGGVLGVFNNTNRTTLVAWQAATGQDATSAIGEPHFVNPTGNASAVDLHLQLSNPAEGRGIALSDALTGAPVALTDDFDGQARSSLTSADVGADAGIFTWVEGIAPVISYPLLSRGSNLNRVLTGWATITDNSGSVSAGASSPRLYYKKSTDANVFGVPNNSNGNGWKYVTATGSGPYSFTIDYSIVNGGSVSADDTVQYFVVAQDAANNLVSNPMGANASANPPVQNVNNSGAVNSFKIAPISAMVTVGSGGTYPSLSGTGGLFAAINAGVLTGDVIANITSDLTETGSVVLGPWLEEGPGNYALRIKPDSSTMRTISGSATAIITLNGADRVAIDGSFGGSGRYLTFQNMSTSSTILFQNDASNNVVRNCVLEGSGTALNTGYGVIAFSSGSVAGNDNNLITGCLIRDLNTTVRVPSSLISSEDSYAGGANSNNTVSNNELFNFSQNGIYISTGNESWTITGNNIYEVKASSSSVTGIALLCSGTNFIVGNFIHDLLTTDGSSQGIRYFAANNSATTTIAQNRITAIGTYLAPVVAVTGISASGNDGSTLNVVNNQITLIPTTAGYSELYGIIDSNSSAGSVVNVFYNSVVLGGTASGTSNSWASYYRSVNRHTSRNNLFLNLRTGGLAGLGGHFAAGIGFVAGVYTASNNVYAGTGLTPANFMDYSYSYGSDAPVSFATWRSSTGDTNSQAGIAGTGNFTTTMFVDVSNGNLKLVPGGNPLVNNVGIPVLGVNDDYDGESRSATTPDRGADEIVATNAPPTAIVLSPSSTSLAENASTSLATELSIISIADDGFGTNVVSLSGADATSFEMDAGKLRLKAGVALDFETKSSYSITVNVDDPTIGTTPDVSTVFNLGITNFAEAIVLNRQIFYNRSTSNVFGDSSGNPVNAIDSSKEALLPGQTSSFVNYTNFVRGLNGLIVDVANLAGTPTTSDFQFATWNGIDNAGFVASFATASVSTIQGGGVGGTNRLKIEFPDNAIHNTWLRVTVLANATTDLSSNSVFYFGHAVGDMNIGNSGTPVTVQTDATDLMAVRQNLAIAANSATIDNIYDVNKDGRVNAIDVLLTRQNQTSNGIRFFTAPISLRLAISPTSSRAIVKHLARLDIAWTSSNGPYGSDSNPSLSVPSIESIDSFFTRTKKWK